MLPACLSPPGSAKRAAKLQCSLNKLFLRDGGHEEEQTDTSRVVGSVADCCDRERVKKIGADVPGFGSGGGGAALGVDGVFPPSS